MDSISFGPTSPQKSYLLKDVNKDSSRNNFEEFKKIIPISLENESNLLLNDSLETSSYNENNSLETIEDRSSEDDEDLMEELK